jgi:hypothetical protein
MPVTHERALADNYRPNESSLLPSELARSLYARERPEGQYPAGTVALRVLEQLLIDPSWHSSYLEGNRKSLLDTRELFAMGHGDPNDPEEMLRLIIDKAREIRNPIEAAFFLWVNIAYLQAFEDGDKRTSRLSANLPLLLLNCAPLSFLDVEPEAYAYAMMGVEERDVSFAAELFATTYLRSIDKYRVALQSFGVGTTLRARYRAQLVRCRTPSGCRGAIA